MVLHGGSEPLPDEVLELKRRFRLGVSVQLWCIPQGQEMDRASAVEADPVSSPLADILRSAGWLQEIAMKDRVAYPLEEGAVLLEDHVREGPLAISSVRPGSAASTVSLEEVLRPGAGQH